MRALITDSDTADLVERLKLFCQEKIDPDAIDSNAEIPPHVIRGLGELGLLRACLPKGCGGNGMSQTSYCRLIQVLGGHCGSTALFVNAHHSIGPRAIVLFGTDQQQQEWLPRLATGEWLSAFALTEPEACRHAGRSLCHGVLHVQTAALVDAGDDDLMLETAMLKVFSTDLLWQIVNDTIQINGGKAYFTDEPFERMMRDARINMIGEGANDVLRVFIALVGMRDVGLELEGILAVLHNPWGQVSQLGRFTARQVASVLAIPEVEVKSAGLETDAVGLGRATRILGRNVQKLLARYKTDVLDRQHHLARIADAATELYVSA